MWPFVSSFFYLACFKDHPHHSMHVSVLHAFLWLNNSIIVCCMYTCVRVCVCVYIYIYIYICHNLFIHSSAVERLGYLYILAVVNNTAVNWYTRICLQTPLAAQWIRICPPMQGTQFQSLVLEDCTGHEAAKPRHHRHWVCALEPASRSYRTCVPRRLKPAHLEPACRDTEPANYWSTCPWACM